MFFQWIISASLAGQNYVNWWGFSPWLLSQPEVRAVLDPSADYPLVN